MFGGGGKGRVGGRQEHGRTVINLPIIFAEIVNFATIQIFTLSSSSAEILSRAQKSSINILDMIRPWTNRWSYDQTSFTDGTLTLHQQALKLCLQISSEVPRLSCYKVHSNTGESIVIILIKNWFHKSLSVLATRYLKMYGFDTS